MVNQTDKKEVSSKSSGIHGGEERGFAQKVNLKAEEVYQKLMPVVPSKNHWFLYGLTVLVSLFIFLIVSVVLVSSSNFFPHMIGYYVMMAAVSGILGGVTGVILDKLVREEKLILYGSLLISILGILCVLIFILMLGKLNNQMETFSESSGYTGTSIGNMFGTPPNPWITAVLMFLFNIFPYVIMSKRKKRT